MNIAFWGGTSSYGNYPVINSYAVIPRAHMSPFWSKIDNSIVSGGNQYGRLIKWLLDLKRVSVNILSGEKYDNFIYPSADSKILAAIISLMN